MKLNSASFNDFLSNIGILTLSIVSTVVFSSLSPTTTNTSLTTATDNL